MSRGCIRRGHAQCVPAPASTTVLDTPAAGDLVLVHTSPAQQQASPGAVHLFTSAACTSAGGLGKLNVHTTTVGSALPLLLASKRLAIQQVVPVEHITQDDDSATHESGGDDDAAEASPRAWSPRWGASDEADEAVADGSGVTIDECDLSCCLLHTLCYKMGAAPCTKPFALRRLGTFHVLHTCPHSLRFARLPFLHLAHRCKERLQVAPCRAGLAAGCEAAREPTPANSSRLRHQGWQRDSRATADAASCGGHRGSRLLAGAAAGRAAQAAHRCPDPPVSLQVTSLLLPSISALGHA